MRLFTVYIMIFLNIQFEIPAISMSIFSLSKSERYFPLVDFVLHRVAKIFYFFTSIIYLIYMSRTTSSLSSGSLNLLLILRASEADFQLGRV